MGRPFLFSVSETNHSCLYSANQGLMLCMHIQFGLCFNDEVRACFCLLFEMPSFSVAQYLDETKLHLPL